MSLKVKVCNCKSLPDIETIGVIDPFVVLTFRGIQKKTGTADNTVNPAWENEEFEWALQTALGSSEVLKIEVYDEQPLLMPNRLVGSLEYPLSQLWDQNIKEECLSLMPSHRAAGIKGAKKATIFLTLAYTSLTNRLSERKKAGVPAGTFDENKGTMRGGNAVLDNKTVTLPDKLTDFQVRIHVIEARRLEGIDIVSLVKVSCGDKFHKTPPKSGTASPVFDQTFIFNFKERPDKFFGKMIEFKVFNTRKSRDSVIGVYSLDIGTVYYEPRHSFFNKWLLLTDQTDPSLGAKGFLKVSLSILGPGDDPVSYVTEFSPDNIDIESNLLRPSGVRLQASTLSVKVYLAEDLPQMDPQHFKSVFIKGSSKKDLLDPYCTVSFAGHQVSTDVKWNTKDPQWNEQLNIGFRFPSVCERIRIELKDKDALSADDYIGTSFIHLPQISASGGDGFLPTFGPCFVNVYGSLREFSPFSDKYDHLNKGMYEGVAYRGRVLLEVSSKVGSLPKEKKELISSTELKKLQMFQHRRKYILRAVFMSASMLQCGNSQVEFEVSIGNFGYAEDETLSSSSTLPMYPVIDDQNYGHMPWYDHKPVIFLESEWENCQYRMESLNLLINTANIVRKGLESVRRFQNLPKKYCEKVRETLESLCINLHESIKSLSQKLPELPNVYNKLDKKLRRHREQEIANLCLVVDKLENMETQTMIEELEVILKRLDSLCCEPQNSVPDVIVWMLVDGRRVACSRIPSHTLIYSGQAATRGALCGKVQAIQLNPPSFVKENERDGNKESCLLRLMLWLGLDAKKKDFSCDPDGPEGEILTVAEIYENELYYGVWGGGDFFAVPNWSNVTGKHKMDREIFETPPTGWVWNTEWDVDTKYCNTEAESETSELYEIQSRSQYCPWPSSEQSFWTDKFGVAFLSYDKEGKEKGRPMTMSDINKDTSLGQSKWNLVISGTVSSDGWEYSTSYYDHQQGLNENVQFVATERTEHLTRRRKWLRTQEKQAVGEKDPEGWVYARHASASLHPQKELLDFFRRRRWVRMLSCREEGRQPVFYTAKHKAKTKKGKKSNEDSDKSSDEHIIVPRSYLTFKQDKYTTYQLRAYLYQARDLYAADRNGLSDPYVLVSVASVSGRSKTVSANLSPKWNQSVLLDNVVFYGSPGTVLASPPPVALELYDKDTIGQDEYIGMLLASPTVRMTPESEPPVLEWFNVSRYDKPAGKILAAFELIMTGTNGWTPEPLQTGPDDTLQIPDYIAPETHKMKIEVLCWGVRDMKRFLLLPIDHPYVEVECGEKKLDTLSIKDMREDPLFPYPVLTFVMDFPVEDVYSPPLNIRVYDKRLFGYHPMIGSYNVSSLRDYQETARTPQLREAKSAASQHEGLMLKSSLKLEELSEEDERFDWWSKYYASISSDGNNDHLPRVQKAYLEEKQDKLKEYKKELETYFDDFCDLAQTFPLYRGKGHHQLTDTDEIVGFFKGLIIVKPTTEDYNIYRLKVDELQAVKSKLPVKWPQEVTVRVYIVRAFDLQPKDSDGSSDPYIKISVGSAEVSDQENYISNELNPVFGKSFEIDAVLPFDRTLTISVMDHDTLSTDDLIGSTTIDLENRFLSLHRPMCGLPETFSKSGCNRWRDMQSPVDILNSHCKMNGLEPPLWNGTATVTVNKNEYKLDQFENGVKLHPNIGDEKNRLALHVLHIFNLVPEHVETRALYNSVHPDIAQGQLHMWVDMFPKLPKTKIPPGVNIAPRGAEKYTLRVVIWNTSNVILDDHSLVTGGDTSDIYVKGWLSGLSSDAQKTDVHYFSLDGSGLFNWRFVFPFDYIRFERSMIVKAKEHFYSMHATEHRVPTIFNLQVWDNDVISDDYLGKIEFDLHEMPLPAKSKRRCNLLLLDPNNRNNKFINLFAQKRVRGWLPVLQENYQGNQGQQTIGNRTLTGKVEVEMEILTEEEVKSRPAGKGRDDPNQYPFLRKPTRSLSWMYAMVNPLMLSFWRQHKKKIILAIIIIAIIFLPLLLL